MTHTQEMLGTHPAVKEERRGLAECIDACFDCAQICTTCADACLAEPMVANLVRCIRTNLDCAAICSATGVTLARQVDTDTRLTGAQLQACAEACRICAEECESHAGNLPHCAVCAAACRRCEQACRQMLAQM